MSITTDALTQMLANQLSNQENNLSQLQTQIATGKQLNRPSDNPTAVTQVMALSSQASQMMSWQSNLSMATSWLNAVSSTSNDVIQAMQSAETLLLQAANQGVQNPSSYQAMGKQLQGMVANLVDLSNTQFDGRAMFAGTSASMQAYDSSGNFLGNNDVPTVVIGPGQGSGQTVGLSVPGTSLFGVGTSNVFNVLTTVANALLSGTPTSSQISSALNGIKSNISTAEQASAILGTSALTVNSVSSALTAQITSIQANQANLQDLNVTTATTQLNEDMTNYQAALWAASKAIPETLQQFIP